MSPVRWRLNSSIGTTWLMPPPAAPPLMPKVGPIDGCRMAIVAEDPMCWKAWPSPTVVVVLPSPSGVGVMAETTTYLARGRSAIASMASSLIFAAPVPYGSRWSDEIPAVAATSSSGFRLAALAISRSVGNDT